MHFCYINLYLFVSVAHDSGDLQLRFDLAAEALSICDDSLELQQFVFEYGSTHCKELQERARLVEMINPTAPVNTTTNMHSGSPGVFQDGGDNVDSPYMTKVTGVKSDFPRVCSTVVHTTEQLETYNAEQNSEEEEEIPASDIEDD